MQPAVAAATTRGTEPDVNTPLPRFPCARQRSWGDVIQASRRDSAGPTPPALPLYLVYADREQAGPGVLRLAQILRERTRDACKAALDTIGASKPKKRTTK